MKEEIAKEIVQALDVWLVNDPDREYSEWLIGATIETILTKHGIK